MPADSHIVITDSGLGGLSICAALERSLRQARPARAVRLTYVNAWPFDDRGYNDLPDNDARARVFDAALARIAQMQPDRILIACNTLSILYPRTVFSRNPPVPVHGIVDAGVDLFVQRLAADPDASIVLLGTKTTIESRVHEERLGQKGIDPRRIAAVSCHGLAGAIEHDVDGPRAAALIAECALRAASAAPPGSVVFLGLCCTHYGYVADRLVDAVSALGSRRVLALDPNLLLTAELVADAATTELARGSVSVELVSKVTLSETARAGIARLVEPVSAATASALLSYAHVPDLF